MTQDQGDIAARAERLTPREWRVVALVLEGVSADHACEALGIAPGTLESHKQAVRRKLAVPRGERLEAFLRQNVGAISVVKETAAEPAAEQARPEPEERASAPGEDERRLRWLLRMTLQELQEVAGSSSLRAELLEQTVRRMGSENEGEASREVRELQYVAAELKRTYDRLLADVRSGAAAAE